MHLPADNPDLRLTIDEELKILDEARDLVILALGQISGMGPDFMKCHCVLHYIDSRRNPLIAELLRDPLEPISADIDWLTSGMEVLQ